MHAFTTLALRVAYALACASTVLAGFNPGLSNNVAIYWGQNSYGQAGSQASLASYCEDNKIDMIPISFMTTLRDRRLNLGPSSLDLESDIIKCQGLGKTILVSFPGALYEEGGFGSAHQAVKGAQDVFAAFGPQQDGSQVSRPFGAAVVDGFDFDFEQPDIKHLVEFGEELDRLRSRASGKRLLLTAAPQCPFPDEAMKGLMGSVSFDALFIQFYNNFCGVKNFNPGQDKSLFNFQTWDTWAREASKNRQVKLLIGAPGNVKAAGEGSYVEPSVLAQAIAEAKKYPSFGGLMLWDMSQTFANPGFLDSAVAALGGPQVSLPRSLSSYWKADLTSLATVTVSTVEPSFSPASEPTTLITRSKTASAPVNLPTGNNATSLGQVKFLETAQFLSPVESVETVTVTVALAPSDTLTSAGTVNQWMQCGGKDWDGGTDCKSPFVCKYFSDWYSQCE